MLVLSRRIGEEIVIAGNIHVRVLDAQGNEVSLGISAPTEVVIMRQELMEGHRSLKKARRSSSAELTLVHAMKE